MMKEREGGTFTTREMVQESVMFPIKKKEQIEKTKKKKKKKTPRRRFSSFSIILVLVGAEFVSLYTFDSWKGMSLRTTSRY